MCESPGCLVGENEPFSPSGTGSCSKRSTTSVFLGSEGRRVEFCAAACQYIRSVFYSGGLTISVADVTVTTQSRLSRIFPKFFPPKKYCDTAVALMRGGRMHVIADVDGLAGAYLLNAITGSVSCASGSVLANGVPVKADVFRKAVGIISNIETFMTNLTVEENIRFVVSMRTKGSWGSKESLVGAACALTELERHKSAKLLSPSEAFRLRLAMEIVRDPPVIVAFYPFDHLGPVDAAESSAILKRVSSVLEKTVIISTRALSTDLFSVADTVLLFGRGGCVLYSGEVSAMLLYFQSFRRFCDSSTSDDRSAWQEHNVGCGRISASNGKYDSVFKKDIGGMYDERHSFSSSKRETRSTGTTETFFSVDDVVDLVAFWAENETITAFYSAKFNESQLRRQMVRAILHCSAPPRDASDVMPFTSTAPPQYMILKPFILLRYGALHTWREAGIFLNVICLLLGLLVISLLMQYQNDDQGGMYNIRGIEFVLFLLTMLVNILAIGDVDHKLRLFFHQRNSGLYGTVCFIIVFVFRTVVARAAHLAFFVPVVLFVVKMRAPYLLLLGALSVVQVFFHVLVHAIIIDNHWAIVVIWLYLGYSIVFSGFLLNLSSMPYPVGNLSILRWAYGAALAQRLRNMPFSCDGTGNTSYCYSGNAYLELEGFLNDSIELSLSVFTVLCGVLILIIGLVLACRG